MPTDWLVNAVAGAGDSLSAGGSNWLRDKAGWNSAVDPSSTSYQNGQMAGDATSLATLRPTGAARLAA
jgi:hypothetical protein